MNKRSDRESIPMKVDDGSDILPPKLVRFFRTKINDLIFQIDRMVVSKIGTIIPSVIFAVSVAVSVHLWNMERKSTIQSILNQLDEQLLGVEYPIQGRIQSYQQILYGIRGLLDVPISLEGVSPKGLESYINSLNLGENFPEVYGVHLPSPFGIQNNGSYQLTNYTKSSTFISLEKKGNNRIPADTSLLYILRQDSIVPYNNTETTGHENNLGIVFNVSKLLEEIVPPNHFSERDFQIYDGQREDYSKLLFDSYAGREWNSHFGLKAARIMTIMNHEWTLVMHSTKISETQMHYQKYLNTIIRSGALVTILLTFFSWFFIQKRRESLITATNLNQIIDKNSYLATHDTLTGLPNHTSFLKRLTGAFSRADRNKTLVALLSINLVNFKLVNNSLGHDNGDELLRQVSARIGGCMRPRDTVSRQGGDEFFGILPIKTPDDAANTASRINAALAEPYSIAGREVRIGSSIGIAMYPTDAKKPDALRVCADDAMRVAKGTHPNGYQFFSSGMQKNPERHQLLATALHHAIERGELSMAFQPIVDATTGEIASMESLLRWNHPELGNISPAEFVPIAESTGLIISIGNWIIRTVCQQISDWTKQGIIVPEIAINLSVYQFRSKTLIDDIEKILLDTNISPSQVGFEITESMLIDDVETAIATIDTLSKMGFKISIDDFGTGYSSLSYLNDFKVSKLKIDRSFILKMDTKNGVLMVKGIIKLAHSLEKTVVAEGVETEGDVIRLREMGCDQIQGYYFGRPERVTDITKRLGRINETTNIQ